MTAALPTSVLIPGSSHRQLEAALSSATDYASWRSAALALDTVNGRERWKLRERSNLYDYATIRERLHRLRSLRHRGDCAGLIFVIEEGVHGNLGGIGKPILYSKARFGTKKLINDYLEAVADALLYIEAQPESVVPAAVKRDLFARASHCYGRSAAMFSAGGTLIYFHFGVVRSLLEQKLLPRVISGSSAGAFIAAVVGTHTDAELDGFLTAENLRIGKEWNPGALHRMTGLRPLITVDALVQTFDRLIPDMTFREAYEHSGRQISISVSPCTRHHSPRLLNAITAPHVLIRSAVRASCAVPGVYEPVQLEARDQSGKTVPYLDTRWVDGLFAADLPAKQLARLYGVNHYIVSLINPIRLPTFRDHKLQAKRLQPLLRLAKESARDVLKSSDVLLGKYLPASTLGVTNKLLHDLLSQEYVGDISIAPARRINSPLRLLSPFTLGEIEDLMRDGERQTWPRIEMIRLCTTVSRTLDGILGRDRGAA